MKFLIALILCIGFNTAKSYLNNDLQICYSQIYKLYEEYLSENELIELKKS